MPHNPLRVNSTIDSCAFDPHEDEEPFARQILELADQGELNIVVAHSTMKEIDHPRTPEDVKRLAAERPFTLDVGLTTQERTTREEILTILAGNGARDRMQADAQHVFEAQKYGGYFITNDNRILNKAAELQRRFGIHIVRPSEFMVAVERARARERDRSRS